MTNLSTKRKEIDTILVLDFGSQYTQLIARRVRELFVYCEIHPYNNLDVDLDSFKAIILSGSPFSVRSKDALHIDLSKIKGKKPLLINALRKLIDVIDLTTLGTFGFSKFILTDLTIIDDIKIPSTIPINPNN